MHSFKEWMVRSVLVRATHRDAELLKLREHYKYTHCGACEKFINPECREFECNAISYICVYCDTRFCVQCDQYATFDGTTDCICKKCWRRPDICQDCVFEGHEGRFNKVCLTPKHKYVSICAECTICPFCKRVLEK